jgi:hypothetical protein
VTGASKQVLTDSEAKGPTPSPANDRVASDPFNVPLFFFGVLLCLFGFAVYLSGILFSLVRLTLSLGDSFRVWNERIIWYSGVPCALGLTLSAFGPCVSSTRKAQIVAT